MQTVYKLALFLGVALTTFAVVHPARADSIDDQISARLNALEKENAALRARITRIEASKPGTKQTRRVTVLDSAAPPPALPAPAALDADNAVVVKTAPTNSAPAFRIKRLAAVLAAKRRQFRAVRDPREPVPGTDA